MINVQNAPALPAPGAGLAGVGDLLGKAGVFKDITGLDATQQNAIKAYLSNQDNAKAFAEMAKEMAMQSHNTQNSDRITDQIDSAKAKGNIDATKASQLTTDHLQQMIDGGQTKQADLDKERRQGMPSVAQAGVDAIKAGSAEVAATTSDPKSGLVESVTVRNAALADTITNAPGNLDQLERQFAADYPYGYIARLPDAPDFALFNFAVNGSDVKRFEGVLNNFGTFFEDLRDKGYSADIVGVASVSGTEAHNAELSFARALAVSNLYEGRFNMPAQRLNARQVGSRMSPPPADVLQTFGQENEEAVRRAWNRRVEIHAVADPWTDSVYDRIIAVLGTAAAPVENAEEGRRAKALATLLRRGDTDDLYVTDYGTLVMNINWFWNKDPLYNRLLLNPSDWDKFTFANHMKAQLAKEIAPTATDQLLTTHLVAMLRAMRQAWASIDRYVTIQQQGGSGAAIHVVIQRVFTWMGTQSQNDESVYSILSAP